MSGSDHAYDKPQRNAYEAGKKGDDQGGLKAVGNVAPPVICYEVQIKCTFKIFPHSSYPLSFFFWMCRPEQYFPVPERVSRLLAPGGDRYFPRRLSGA
ncbi:MAG: hypothetical protein ACLT5X_03055 [Blautia producta]